MKPSSRRAVITVVTVVVVVLVAGIAFHDSDRKLLGFGSKKTPGTLADGSPVPLMHNGSPVPTFKNHTPVPTLPDGTPLPTVPDDPRNTGKRAGSGRSTTTRFVASKEDDPDADWAPTANCPTAEAKRPAVMTARFVHTDGTALDYDRVAKILDESDVPREHLERLGKAHFLSSIANPGTVGGLLPGAKRLAAHRPGSGEAAVDVELHCEAHTRNDGTITLIIRDPVDPDAVVYRNGFRDTVDRNAPLSDHRGAALWVLKTDKSHAVRRVIAYMKDRDVLGAYPGGDCPVQNGDPNRRVECGLKVS